MNHRTLSDLLGVKFGMLNESEKRGLALAERLYSSLGAPADGPTLANVLQRIINTLKRKQVPYPAIFVRRRAQLLGKALDGSTWAPGQEEHATVELAAAEQVPPRSEQSLVEHARAIYSPQEFERWAQMREAAKGAAPRKVVPFAEWRKHG